MLKTYSHGFTFVFFILLLMSLVACSSGGQATPTPTLPPATNTPLPTPTITNTPTSTPSPTATPNVSATETYNNLLSKVQMFKDEGLIPSTSGKYIVLGTYYNNFSQIGWLSRRHLDVYVENFVFNGNVSWSTAKDTSDKSGCGVVFGVEEKESNDEYYGVVLDKSRIYFTMGRSGHYYELGKTRGTGQLDFGNPAEAELTLLVYDKHAYVYVDNNFIGEYTLSQDKELRGKFGYAIISGTNYSYGTHCEIMNTRIWELIP